MTNNEAPTSSSPLFCLANANDNNTNQIFPGKRKANETATSEKPSLSGAYFFKLSSPLKNFHNLINHTFENKRKEISSNEIFNFNQPYQAKSFQLNTISFNNNNNNRSVLLVDQTPFSIMKSIKCQENNQRENNLVIINSNRNHPYIRSTNGQQISEKTNNYNNSNNNNNLFNNAIANSNTSLNQNLNEKTNVISNDSLSSSPIRNSSSNSILAQLKSISPSFKSIFVRPKTHKPIDASALFNKPKLHNKNVSLPQLRREEYSLTNIQDSSFLNNILPRIELKELRLNSSVDEILRKLANEDDVIRRTIKNYSNSKTSSDLNASQNFSKIAITNAEKSTFGTGLLSTEEIESSKLLYPSQSKHQVADMAATGRSKWTCMVCLSKHSTKLDVCSICGSSKSNSISLQNVQEPTSASYTSSSSSSTLAVSLKKRQQQTTPLSSSTPSTSPSSKLFSSYLINELGLKQKYSTSGQPQQKKPTTPNVSDNEVSFSKKNPYIKKWTCLQCNFQNDSLKIVCLNCRWAKTSLKMKSALQTQSRMTGVLALDEPAVKRNKLYNNILTINVMDSVSQDKETKKDKNNNFLCSSCKSPIKSDSSSSSEIIELHPSSPEATNHKEKEPLIAQPVTTTFPSFFAQKPLATESDKTTKWKCDTCLVSNPDTADKCLCCMTSKPGTSKPAVSLSENLNQLKPLSSTSKWTCDTCLVSNDADKTNCICCMTPKAGSTSSIKSPPTSLNMATAFKLNETNINPSILAGSSSIKFGSDASTSSMPIKFGAPSGTVIKFDSFKQSSEEKQDSEKILFSTKTMELPKNFEKPFKFDLPSQPFLNGNKPDVESAPKFSFTSSLSNPIAPISSTSTNNELIFKEPNKSTIKPLQTLENSNKLESQAELASPFKFIPLGLNFSSSTPSVQTATVDSFFSPKTITTPSTNTTTTATNNTQISSAPSFSFLSNNQSNNNKPNESVSSLSFSSTAPTRNLFEIVSPQPPQQFNTTNSFSSGNQTSSLFSNTKPSFSSSFGSTELQPNITAFVNVGTTSNSLLSSSSQPFPQFDFKPTTPEHSFPSLNNQQQSKGFQFASFGLNIPNPTINFVENPSTIIFSGNTETGMNTSAEAPRRFRKGTRKHHRY